MLSSGSLLLSARRLALLSAFTACFALLGGDALAQEWIGRGRLEGRITGPEGQPIKGATVELHFGDEEGPGPPPLETNKKGRWSYLGLTGGTWLVRVSADGCVPSQGTVKVGEFGHNPAVDIELREITEEMKAPAEPNPALEAIETGNSFLGEGKPKEAREAYERALSDLEKESHPPVLRAIARAYYEEGKKKEAIATLEKALEIAGDDEDTLRLVINLLVDSDREEEAKVYMDRLPEGARVEADALLNVGIKAYNKGELEAALAEFDRVVAQDPELSDAYYYRGMALMGSDRGTEALADFEKYLAMEPDSARAEEVRQFVEYLKSLE